MKLLIKGGRVVDFALGIDGVYDILVEGGRIAALAPSIQVEGAEEIDAVGKTVLPGLVDLHCHLRDPGYEYKEDLATGTASAAKGGFTSIVAMPNTSPVCDNKAVASYIKNTAKVVGKVHVYPAGAISKGLLGKELAEMEDMKAAGVVAVTDDGMPVENAALFKKALVYANMLGLPVISHSEELSLIDGGCMNESATSTMLGLKGIPTAAEEIMVARDVMLAEYTGTPVHITHISAAGCVGIIREAKARGVKVTCDTCPHYFSLTDQALLCFDTNAKVNPPLRTRPHLEAIIEGIKDGTIDAIATDHAPHHIDDKNLELDHAANGMIGFETAFAVAYTYLVKPGQIGMKDLVRLMSFAPAQILSLPAGSLNVGATADITIVDEGERFVVREEEILSKSKNTPYIGYTLTGKVAYTIVAGVVNRY